MSGSTPEKSATKTVGSAAAPVVASMVRLFHPPIFTEVIYVGINKALPDEGLTASSAVADSDVAESPKPRTYAEAVGTKVTR